MADHITDEMVETLAMVIAGNVTPAQMRANPAEARRTRREARLALAAVAPLIRAQAFKEAAAIAAEHRDDCAGKLSRGRKNWSDHDIAVFESAESEANSIAAAILALAEKETTDV